MIIYTGKDLADAFRTVRKNTQTIAGDIPEAKYSFRPTPDTRTVAQTLVHISLLTELQHQVHAVERRSTLAGFDFPAFMQRMVSEEQKPRTKDQIVTMLSESGQRFATWLESLSDEFLAERVGMPPGMTPDSKTRF